MLLSTAIFAVVLTIQFRTKRYVPLPSFSGSGGSVRDRYRVDHRTVEARRQPGPVVPAGLHPHPSGQSETLPACPKAALTASQTADTTSLQAVNNTTWTLLDDQMDAVLKTYAIDHGGIRPAPVAEQEKQLTFLLGDLKTHHF